MKKIFYILVFFIVAGGIFYLAENLNAKNGVTMEELVQLVNGDSSADEKKIEEGLENIKDENMLSENKFSPFINIGKNLSGKVREIYDGILANNYRNDNSKFIKLASNLKPEEMKNIFETLKRQNIDVSGMLESIQNTMKDTSLTEEQRNKLKELLSQIK